MTSTYVTLHNAYGSVEVLLLLLLQLSLSTYNALCWKGPRAKN